METERQPGVTGRRPETSALHVGAERQGLGRVGRLPEHVEALRLVHRADEHAAFDVVVLAAHRDVVARRAVEAEPAKGRTHFRHVERAGLLGGHRPQMHAVIGRDHRIDRHIGLERHLVGGDIVGPVREELLVLLALGVLQIGPAVQVADERLGVEPLEVSLDRIECQNRHVEGADALVDELAEEVGDRVADHGKHDDRLAAGLVGEIADLVDQRLEVREAKRNVFLTPRAFLDALRFPIALELLVDRARPDIVGTKHEEALRRTALLAHQVFDGGQHRRGRRRVQIDDVLRVFLALEMQRVIQQRIVLLDHRQHRFAAHRGPAPEGHGDLFLLDQLFAELGIERPVGARIGDHRLDHLAENAALGVDLVGRHLDDVVQAPLDIRHRARGREQAAELHGVAARGIGAADQPRQRKRARGGGKRGAAGGREKLTSFHWFIPVGPQVVFCRAIVPRRRISVF
ncbi:hypothetical protein SDC9_50789 [bioreactor metagenome]|uniref:Uncharacterized protein n=1 Tax=bioreactor metagenome TaxID=1076179 RepID=A0A644WLS6_9ZZZZ